MKTSGGRRRPGRPRSFDPEQALDRAMRVFWAKGYEGASLSDLVRATGLNPPSLYGAFGNKASVFLCAAERYFAGPLAYLDEAVRQPTALRVARYALEHGARLFTNQGNPAGCLFVTCALSSSSLEARVRQRLVAERRRKERGLRTRFRRAVEQGDLPRRTDAAALARYLMGLHFGLAVHASTGTSRAGLLRMIRLALVRWPVLDHSR